MSPFFLPRCIKEPLQSAVMEKKLESFFRLAVSHIRFSGSRRLFSEYSRLFSESRRLFSESRRLFSESRRQFSNFHTWFLKFRERFSETHRRFSNSHRWFLKFHGWFKELPTLALGNEKKFKIIIYDLKGIRYPFLSLIHFLDGKLNFVPGWAGELPLSSAESYPEAAFSW